MFGKLLGSVVRIANAPIRTVEDLVGMDTENERLFSKPADFLAEELEEIDEDD